MKENVRKAIRIDEAPMSEDIHTSTAVDDFFFVLQKCSQRSLAYGNLAVEPNVAVMRHVAGTLSADLLPYVRKRLKETQAAMEKMVGGSSFQLHSAAMSSVTFLAEFAKQNIANAAEAAAVASGTNNASNMDNCTNGTASDAKYDFFVAVNNAATSADYALRLRSTIEKTGEAAKSLSQSDRARLSSALVPVSDAARLLSVASENGMATLTSALVGQIGTQVEQEIEKTKYMLSDQIDDDDCFSTTVSRLVTQKVLSDALEARLTEGNWDELVRHTAEWVAQKAENGIFVVKGNKDEKKSKRFNALGAIGADRDVRALSKYFASKSRRATVRDVFARLSQICMLLNLEKPAEVYEVWGDKSSSGMAWRLTATEVRRALLLRRDFSRDAIAALKL